MDSSITKEEYEIKMKEDFHKTLAFPKSMFLAGLIDLIFILGPSIIMGFFALKEVVSTFQIFLWLAIMFVAHVIITNIFKHNSIGKLAMGVRLASSKTYRLLSDDPNAYTEYTEIGKDITDKEDVFVLFDALNGYRQSKLNKLGIVKVNLKRFQSFQEKYKIHKM